MKLFRGLMAGSLLTILVMGADSQAAAQGAPVITDPIRQGNLLVALEIEERLAEANLGRRTQLGVSVLDMERGATVVDVGASRPLPPASVLKLVTGAVALELLGPDHQFTTSIETPGLIEGNTLFGDLIIRGGGDPTLGPRLYEGRRSGALGQLEDFARALRQMGIRTIEGNIIGDDTRYPNDPHAIGWDPREFGEWYSAEVSALTYNENVVDIFWRSSSRTGDRASFTLDPPTGFVQFSSTVRVGPADQGFHRIRYARFAQSNEIRARGSMPPNRRLTDFAAIHNPARFTATLMTDALRKHGITVRGVPVSQRDLGTSRDDEDFQILLEHDSPPLEKILPIMLGDSQNLYAELILRESAYMAGRTPSFRGGSELATQWLMRQRLHRSGFTMVDGSGLSPINRMSARMITGILYHQARGNDADVWKSALAAPGTRSLQGRFEPDADSPPAIGSLLAKTGYIAGTHSLAGYFTTETGRQYAFAIIVSDFDANRLAAARNFIDRTVEALVDHEQLR